MKEYTYNGPVMNGDMCCMRNWTATTMAQSEKKARANLSYRYKKEFNIFKGAHIWLPGKFIERAI